ncbi:TetR/AcrR family transcriptional regulator [Nocardia flavorosea]|uniref:TetR family transcriptional regulator n=1 Tax=Nocardia flavorosea TaxID=53429 RepID=A0A846YEI5_9NOCA|nr:TetR/AcrR family transcriptional regulator [Nocardia flavorosea]NKY58046.1 TetR family transcriptional regulator [Nocardia flavorosea]
MADEPHPSLRERKKRDTRKALSDAALELMFERGIDNVVREDIAERAGVSVRTFNNYFAGKFEALAYRHIERLRRSAALLLTRPAGEPLWTALTEALVEPLREDGAGGPPTLQMLAETRKLRAAPEMQAAAAKALGDELIVAVAQRSGTEPTDLYPKLVAATVNAAYLVALDTYSHSDPPAPVTTVLREVLAHLSQGLPAPAD